MQFLPQTWHAVARDGDGDGKMNPDDIDDSALGVRGLPLRRRRQPRRPGRAWRERRSATTTPTTTCSWCCPSRPATRPASSRCRPRRRRRPKKKADARQAQGRAHATPKPTKHAATKPRRSRPPSTADARRRRRSPPPKPDARSRLPSPARARRRPRPSSSRSTAPGQACGHGVLPRRATSLDLGPQNGWGDRADADFDGDGTVETNAQEFAGLVDQHVDAPGRARRAATSSST